jgi:2-C-methyl-D-erythritol 4-phosphate cytidylyltransferase/2-C-methyl-D-erythritol 2,4-cyclodiphosphate synthase
VSGVTGAPPGAADERDGPGLPADVIVVAAGRSRRMEGQDKLFATLAGEPLLARTLAALAATPVVARIVVVTAAERVVEVREAHWLPDAVVAVIAGGARRQESVAAGLRVLDDLDGPTRPDDRVVLVHDGARPLVSPDLVTRVALAVSRAGAAVPVLPVHETLKRLVDGVIHETVDRTSLATAQTPQGARRGLLRAAFATHPPDGPREFTDEAALLEACRIVVHAVPGEPSNIKVTLPGDLGRVEQTVGHAGTRVGLGHDRHPFGPGGPLRLGGIEIMGAPRLAGHSDGDVALHAVADALLGAAALGDLGRLFPADARTPRGIASRDLLGEVVDRVTAAGFRPESLDILVVGARPRLGTRLDEMRRAIASLVGLPVERVSVKASTGNLDGMEGAGRGISAQVVASVVEV